MILLVMYLLAKTSFDTEQVEMDNMELGIAKLQLYRREAQVKL